MADDRLRELERRWEQSGDAGDRDAYLQARQRQGLGPFTLGEGGIKPASSLSHGCLSPDGRLCFGAALGGITVWDTESGSVLATFARRGRASGFALHPTQVGFAVSDRFGVFVYTGLEAEQEPRQLGEEPKARVFTFSADGERVAAAGGDKGQLLQVWSVGDGALLGTFKGSRSSLNDAAFSPSGALVAAVGDRTVRVYDVASGKRVHQLKGHPEKGTRVRFLDEHTLLSEGGTVASWDLRTGLPSAREWPPKKAGETVIRPDGAYAKALVVDHAGQETKVELVGYLGVHDLSADGQLVLVAGAHDEQVILFDVGRGATREFGPSHVNRIHQLELLPGERLLSSGGNAIVWDLASCKAVEAIPPLPGASTFDVRSAFSPDGRWLVTSGQSQLTLREREAPYAAVHELKGHKAKLGHLRFTADSQHLLSIGARSSSVYSRAFLWNVETGEAVWEQRGPADAVLLREREGRMTWLTRNEVETRDLYTGELIYSAILPGPGLGVAMPGTLSRSGRIAARVFGNRQLWVWNAETREPLATFDGVPYDSNQLCAISADERFLAVTAESGVRLWDLSTLSELDELEAAGWITGLCWRGSTLLLTRRSSIELWSPALPS